MEVRKASKRKGYNNQDGAYDTHEQQERNTADRFASTLVIASGIIAAVRLARENISGPSPKVVSTVSESVSLARMILKRVTGQ